MEVRKRQFQLQLNDRKASVEGVFHTLASMRAQVAKAFGLPSAGMDVFWRNDNGMKVLLESDEDWGTVLAENKDIVRLTVRTSEKYDAKRLVDGAHGAEVNGIPATPHGLEEVSHNGNGWQPSDEDIGQFLSEQSTVSEHDQYGDAGIRSAPMRSDNALEGVDLRMPAVLRIVLLEFLAGIVAQNVQTIEEQTFARITIAQDPPAPPLSDRTRVVTIEGTLATNAAAQIAIHRILTMRPDDDNHPVTLHMLVPNHITGAIIGKRAVMLSAFKARSGARIELMRDRDVPQGVEFRLVTLYGNIQQLRVCQILISEHIERLLSWSASKEVHETMTVPASHVRFVVGRKSVIVQQIMRQSGAHIEIEREIHDGTQGIKLSGSPDAVSRARKLVDEVLSFACAKGEAAPAGHETLELFCRDFGPFRDAERLRLLERDLGVTIHATANQATRYLFFDVDGDPQSVERTKEILRTAVEMINLHATDGTSPPLSQGDKIPAPSELAPTQEDPDIVFNLSESAVGDVDEHIARSTSSLLSMTSPPRLQRGEAPGTFVMFGQHHSAPAAAPSAVPARAPGAPPGAGRGMLDASARPWVPSSSSAPCDSSLDQSLPLPTAGPAWSFGSSDSSLSSALRAGAEQHHAARGLNSSQQPQLLPPEERSIVVHGLEGVDFSTPSVLLLVLPRAQVQLALRQRTTLESFGCRVYLMTDAQQDGGGVEEDQDAPDTHQRAVTWLRNMAPPSKSWMPTWPPRSTVVPPEEQALVIDGTLGTNTQAEQRIASLVGGSRPAAVSNDLTRLCMLVPNAVTARIIGKKGAVLNGIIKRCGVHSINLTPDEDMWPGLEYRRADIQGTADQVRATQVLLSERIQKVTQPEALVHDALAVSSERVGQLIGRDGSTIKRVMRESGASVEICPEKVDGNQAVKFTGPRRAVQRAKRMVRDLLATSSLSSSAVFNRSTDSQGLTLPPAPPAAQTEEVVWVPVDHMPFVSTRQNALVRAIERQCNVSVHVSNRSYSNAFAFAIAGTAEAVSSARALLEVALDAARSVAPVGSAASAAPAAAAPMPPPPASNLVDDCLSDDLPAWGDSHCDDSRLDTDHVVPLPNRRKEDSAFFAAFWNSS